ncbi:MAG: hypothetical protein QXW98_08390 [Candidatus Caldarchaeum sp.]
MPQFTEAVDQLHLYLWNGGFRYRGSRLLGYETRYQQANRLAQLAEEARAHLLTVQQLIESINNLAEQAQQTITAVNENKISAETLVQDIQNLLPQAQYLQSQVQGLVSEIERSKEMASEYATNAEASAQNASVHEKRIQQFIEKVDANEKRLTDAVKTANETVQKVRDEFRAFQQEKQQELNDFFDRLKEIEQSIKDKLAKATGVSLFETFEIRHRQIWQHWVWVGIALVTFAGGLWYIHNFLSNSPSVDIAFFIRLGLTIPMGLVIAFALRQYALERRLKEEYRYKSTISLSLEAYRNLVEQAVEKLTPEERVRFADFLIENIARIFESPTDKVFGGLRPQLPKSLRSMKESLEVAKQLKDIIDRK